jgi:hypothetical protein
MCFFLKSYTSPTRSSCAGIDKDKIQHVCDIDEMALQLQRFQALTSSALSIFAAVSPTSAAVSAAFFSSAEGSFVSGASFVFGGSVAFAWCASAAFVGAVSLLVAGAISVLVAGATSVVVAGATSVLVTAAGGASVMVVSDLGAGGGADVAPDPPFWT